MEFHIQQLEEAIRAYDNGGGKASSDKIKQLVYTISQGISLTEKQREKLWNIVWHIKVDQGLKWVVTQELREKLLNKIKCDRRHVASQFYSSRGYDTAAVDAIDYHDEVTIDKITAGTSMYQWCKWVVTKDGKSLFNTSTQRYMIGNYYCDREIPLIELGAFPLFDLYHANGSYRGRGKQILCKFVFPFDADCLISTTKKTIDTWNVTKEPEGSPLRSRGFRTDGGAIQYFIPLTQSQKRILAENVQFTSRQSSID